MMEHFINYISDILHTDVKLFAYDNSNKLPLYLNNAYDLYVMTLHNIKCLLAFPKETSNLTVLRKQIVRLKNLSGMNTVLWLDNVRIYTKEKMLAEGIPFIINGQQIYMPFLGLVLSKNDTRDIPYKEKISFLTQRLILSAIYGNWKNMKLTEIAKILEISKMSVSRCFDELVSLGLDIVKSNKKLRRFVWENDRRSLWDTVHPFLRNPIKRQYNFRESISFNNMKLAGMSAVSHYSMLGDNPYMTYALETNTGSIEITKKHLVPNGENPEMVLQILSYSYNYSDSVAIDPLSAILSLSDEEKDDPHVGLAIDEILKRCLNG